MAGELDQIAVAIAAPYPSPHSIREGWMSRIGAIDREFAGLCRIYLNFATHHDDSAAKIIWREASSAEVLLNPQGRRSANLVARICEAVKLIYVHTLHLADYMLPWMETGKVCVDIHGVTPEEEEMIGRPELKTHYEAVEKAVLTRAMKCIAVSNAMVEHYANKYPQLHPSWITVPVLEHLGGNEGAARSRSSVAAAGAELPVAVVYMGGTQPWQNVAGMLELVRSTGDWAQFDFYSHEQKLIRNAAKAMNLRIRAGFCDKERLPGIYTRADFGLVLRDDTAVNRVACPTKLTEYLRFGVIPIVRSAALGDFSAKGYQFVLESDFKAGFFPDAASREWMIARNYCVIDALAQDYVRGAALLRDLAAGLASTGG